MQHQQLTELVKSLGEGEAFYTAAYNQAEMTQLGADFYRFVGVPTEISHVDVDGSSERVATIPEGEWRTLVFGTYDVLGTPIVTLVVVDTDEKEQKVMEMADDAPLIVRWTAESFQTVPA